MPLFRKFSNLTNGYWTLKKVHSLSSSEHYRLAGLAILSRHFHTSRSPSKAPVLPDLSKHIQFHTLGQPAFDRVCHQFAIVYGHLRKALVTQVNIIIPELLKTNRESDSSDEEVPEMCDVRHLSYTRWPNEICDCQRPRFCARTPLLLPFSNSQSNCKRLQIIVMIIHALT
jgi:hypothetical protein